jgi:16S rRNA (adenine1518-N6/adenine1519-N6)-dimethyltransferase
VGAPRFERLTCTIQREVGERLAAAPRTENYGVVSVVVQTVADLMPLAIIPASAFWPRPQVESVMITLRPRPPEDLEVGDVLGFVALVQRGFQQRRKMLRRLVRDWNEGEALLMFQRAGVSPDARSEELSPAAWRALFAALRRTVGR